MADQIIQGSVPGGARLLDVSPNGVDQLTPIRVDPGVRHLVFDIPVLAGMSRVRLQWTGKEGDAFAAAIARPLPEGEVKIAVPGWGPDGPVFYLSAPLNTPVLCSASE